MKTCYSTLSCPDWSWHDLLRCGREAGFDGVEIRLLEGETDLLAHPVFARSEWDKRRRDLESHQFAVCGLASSVRFDEQGTEDRQRQLETGRLYVDLAVALGATFVRVFGDVVPDWAANRASLCDHVARGLSELGSYAETNGVDILIETHGDFAESSLMAEMLNRVESRAVGVVWDTHHPWRFYGESIEESFALLQPWVRHTHWKDSITRSVQDDDTDSAEAAARAHSLMTGHRHADYVLFGGGEFPAYAALRCLHEMAYDGWFSLEWEKAWHPQLEVPEVALPLFPPKIREMWELVAATASFNN